jgi:hypothetical protein
MSAPRRRRFAVYPFWFWICVIHLFSLFCLAAAMIYGLALLSGAIDRVWPLTLLFVLTLVCNQRAVSGPYWRAPHYRFRPLRDWDGTYISSESCPECGQSCFNYAPPSGYVEEMEKHHFWPRRNCANCGRDLTVR